MASERVEGLCLAALERERYAALRRRQWLAVRVWVSDRREIIVTVVGLAVLLVAAVALGQAMQRVHWVQR